MVEVQSEREYRKTVPNPGLRALVFKMGHKSLVELAGEEDREANQHIPSCELNRVMAAKRIPMPTQLLSSYKSLVESLTRASI